MLGFKQEKYRSPRAWRLLVCGVIVNALGVRMVAFGDFGVSAISSFAYGLNAAFPVLSFGEWTYLFQIALVLALILLLRQADEQYLLAFVVSVIFGYLLDGFGALLGLLPKPLWLRVGFYGVGTFVMATGTCLAVASGLPILPQDLFLRELHRKKGWKLQNIKTVFDCSCVAGSILVGLLVTGKITGVGLGTLISALAMGKCVGLMQRRLIHWHILENTR